MDDAAAPPTPSELRDHSVAVVVTRASERKPLRIIRVKIDPIDSLGKFGQVRIGDTEGIQSASGASLADHGSNTDLRCSNYRIR